MIFPWLRGVLRASQCPVTWSLFLINGLILSLSSISIFSQFSYDKYTKDGLFLKTQGKMFSQFVETNPAPHSALVRSLAHRVSMGEFEKAEMLGSLAFRSKDFLHISSTFPFVGDVVAIRIWQDKIRNMEIERQFNLGYSLGLSSMDSGWLQYISYMFVHSGFNHFFSNMIFLILFGCALEFQFGGLVVLILYLLGGITSALTFTWISEPTLVPLVGASGAVSALMSFYAVKHWREPTRFMYWLFIPARGFMGIVWLPGWVLLLLWILSDLGGLLSSVLELGGVAYSAHLGGEALGILLAGASWLGTYGRHWWAKQTGSHSVLDHHAASSKNSQLYVLEPFFPRDQRTIWRQ